MPANDGNPLQGLSVLITRPSHQATQFSNRLQQAGATVVRLPTIEISFNATTPAQNLPLASDILIFTSANAVAGAHRLLPLPWPVSANSKIAAIGPTTGCALAAHGISKTLLPTGDNNSEGLLATLASLPLADKLVTIVRGDSGRDYLRQQLVELGARVEYLEVYRRQLPQLSPTQIAAAISQSTVTTVGSDLALNNLVTLLEAPELCQVLTRPLIVNSERCRQLARQIGFSKQVNIATPPGDDGQYSALCEYARSVS